TLLADQGRRAREARDLLDENNFSRSEYETLLAERSAREARLLQIQADLEIQRTRVDRHTVRAPFSGVITRRLAQAGQRVTGNTPLLELASMDPIWAEVQLPEQYLGRIQTGGIMKLQTAADQNQWREATLTRVVPVTSSDTRTFLVRAELANADWALAPGMSIRVQLPLDSAANRDVLQVPQDAVTRLPTGETRLWVVSPGEPATVSARPIQLGRRSGALVEIVAGQVSVKDLVVVRGNEALREGQEVVMTREQAAR
ncbi:MAG: efflux RND transporter periplasmic adaptor subunit, partial [Pseudomonadota bacterium]